MKLHLFLRSCLGLTAALLLSQCASTPQTRIERNPQLFAALSTRDRQLVISGVIREGMTRDAVFLAWGRPDRVSVGTNRGKEVEAWTYLGERPVRTFSIGMGFGYGGFGYGGWGPYGYGGGYGFPYMGGGPSVMYVPYTAGVVEFSRGRVTRWMATPR
ncbi:hypothetical protein [Prosthecobacter sp.]|uniref:hypothetical protein n=1 Tax=Prosthecobacter sp. TaxID=1965333 RepID=UPI002AB8D986|nr:hypothetical protein [Prosthecobacter sp.]MDZ4404617.1 hypothetical protein [Prosthecobacter sp.]